MTPDHIDVLSTDAGGTLAALDADVLDIEDDGFISLDQYLTIRDCE